MLANQKQTLEHCSELQAMSLPGIFRVFCSTLHHLARGMHQIYEVSSCGNKDPPEQPYGMIRTFYIAAEEVEWDYAPNKNWEFEKQHLDAGGERYHRPSRRRLWGGLAHVRGRSANAERKRAPGVVCPVLADRHVTQEHEVAVPLRGSRLKPVWSPGDWRARGRSAQGLASRAPGGSDAERSRAAAQSWGWGRG